MVAAKDAEKKADRYESVKKEGGEEYTYFKKENYIDLAFANAKSITTLASFVANFCGLSLGVPLPDVDGILEDVRGLTKDYTLAEVYSGLTDPLGNNVQNMYVNDILKGKGLNTFGPVYSRQHEEIEAAMKNGPCAKDILMLIPEILRYTDNVKGHKEEVASALWYYYGWRLQYDYQVLLSDIYNDRV